MGVTAGLSLDEINYIDDLHPRVRNEIYTQIAKRENLSRYRNMLDIAEAVKMGFAVTQNKKNRSLYKKWRNRITRAIDKILEKDKDKASFWDFVKNKSVRL